MSVVIIIDGQEATITDGEWQTENPLLQELLQVETDNAYLRVGPEESDKDLYAAKMVIEELGNGEIIRADEPEFDEKVVY